MFRLTLEREKRSWSKSELADEAVLRWSISVGLRLAEAAGVDERELFEAIGDGDQASAK